MNIPQRQNRNRRLIALYRAGATKTELARLSELTFMQIHRILQGVSRPVIAGDRTPAHGTGNRPR